MTIELIGGIERFISQGDKVFIKPNLTIDKSHEFGATTNPKVVKAIVDIARRAGAKDTVIGEGAMVGSNTVDIFETLGYLKLAERTGVRLVAAAWALSVLPFSACRMLASCE